MVSKHGRKLDVVVLGATGFAAGLSADYLSAHPPPAARLALAGRNRGKGQGRLACDVHVAVAELDREGCGVTVSVQVNLMQSNNLD